jgi:hypothetical protein
MLKEDFIKIMQYRIKIIDNLMALESVDKRMAKAIKEELKTILLLVESTP